MSDPKPEFHVEAKVGALTVERVTGCDGRKATTAGQSWTCDGCSIPIGDCVGLEQQGDDNPYWTFCPHCAERLGTAFTTAAHRIWEARRERELKAQRKDTP